MTLFVRLLSYLDAKTSLRFEVCKEKLRDFYPTDKIQLTSICAVEIRKASQNHF